MIHEDSSSDSSDYPFSSDSQISTDREDSSSWYDLETEESSSAQVNQSEESESDIGYAYSRPSVSHIRNKELSKNLFGFFFEIFIEKLWFSYFGFWMFF